MDRDNPMNNSLNTANNNPDSRDAAPANEDRRQMLSQAGEFGGFDAELASLVASSRQIANMAEPTILTAAELDAQRIIHPGMKNRQMLNRFRELRTKLLRPTARGRVSNPITLVTSVVPGGGASFTALNLAAAFALDESKTALIIDCNLHTPTLHEQVYLEPECGLTDFLRGDVTGVDSIIYATGVARLRLIPVGNQGATSAEFFTSPRMRAFLDVVRRRYPDRHIFLDAPAVNQSADARILASLCDRALLVVPYGKALKSQVEAAVEAVGEEKLAGVILNN